MKVEDKDTHLMVEIEERTWGSYYDDMGNEYDYDDPLMNQCSRKREERNENQPGIFKI